MHRFKRLFLSTFLSISVVISMIVSFSSCNSVENSKDNNVPVSDNVSESFESTQTSEQSSELISEQSSEPISDSISEQTSEPSSEPISETPLVTNHTFSISGTHTARGGYISGTTTPSVSINLAEIFNLKALVDENYSCNITVNYFCKVIGDHLNVKCSLSGPTNEQSEYVYLDHNEGSFLSLSSYNIPPSSFSNKATLYVKWDCKGVTPFDGLNECEISDVSVSVSFVQY